MFVISIAVESSVKLVVSLKRQFETVTKTNLVPTVKPTQNPNRSNKDNIVFVAKLNVEKESN